MKRTIGKYLADRIKTDKVDGSVTIFDNVDISEYIFISNDISRASTNSRRAYAASEGSERRYFSCAKYDSPLHTGKVQISYLMSDGLHPDTRSKQAFISDGSDYVDHVCYVGIPYRKSDMSDEDYMAAVEDELEVALAKQHIRDCIEYEAHIANQKRIDKMIENGELPADYDDINYN